MQMFEYWKQVLEQGNFIKKYFGADFEIRVPEHNRLGKTNIKLLNYKIEKMKKL